jgi:spore germination cell wall hydrolase CwlJ-like protein
MQYLKKLLVLIIGFVLLTHVGFASNGIKIKVNNKYLTPDTSAFIRNSSTYVPIRFISEALNIKEIYWNSKSNSVIIKNNSTTIALFINKNYAYINDKYVQLENNVLISNSRTFVPIRFIAECFNAKVEWKDNIVTITTNSNNNTAGNNVPSEIIPSNKKPSNSTSSSTTSTRPSNTIIAPSDYNDSLYWLSRIIEAEAGGEPFNGKVAVGEVILNRVKSTEFPNTIWSVIFDNKFGVQFEPVANGTIYNTPSEESLKAAKVALDGSNYVGDCLYFLNPTIAKSNWITKNRDYYTTISNHEFYV